jgi:Flp pilus assembly protein TadG
MVHFGTRVRAAADETGQVIVFALVAMVVLIAMVGFAVDVGHAYLVQRQLQSGVDAAALAGAQHLPDSTQVTQVAQDYGPSPGKKNEVGSNDNATTTVTMKCLQGVPGCSSAFNTYNAVNVKATSDVKTIFAKLIGVNTLSVSATATACSPCSAKALDIMVVLDRTGSMCQKSNGADDHPACTDMTNAKSGIRAFLGFMDPTLDRVGLAVFPPAYNSNNRCTLPTNGQQRYGYDTWYPSWTTGPGGQTPGLYAIASLEDKYLVRNPSGPGYVLASASQSPLINMIECVGSAGTTAYANAIDEAQHELDVNGRSNVQDVIVFVSDGAANTTPRWVPSYLDNANDRLHPCQAGVKAAGMQKAKGTIIYSIGYDLNGMGTDWERCKTNTGGTESITAYDAIRQIATDTTHFYNQPDPQALNQIFTQIAADLQRPAARLIDDGLQ